MICVNYRDNNLKLQVPITNFYMFHNLSQSIFHLIALFNINVIIDLLIFYV